MQTSWVKEAVRRVACAEPELCHEFLAELFTDSAIPEFAAARALGESWADKLSVSDAARNAMRLVRELTSGLREAKPDPARVEEAIACLIDAHDSMRRAHRQAWISYYSHEIRNPLGTIVNALWLLKSPERLIPVGEVCDMAERAAKRLGAMVTALRDLEGVSKSPPPARSLK